jgi:hypothetical protein
MDPEHFAIHALFDLLAWAAAAAMAFFVTKKVGVAFPVDVKQRRSYYAALISGAALGAYLFGTLNMIACGDFAIARSIEGAIFGAVFSVELYKRFSGISARTGARFAAPLAIGVAVGRIGCFYAGIEDFTYGTPTNLPWGHDFGDGVLRHPVPLYESLAPRWGISAEASNGDPTPLAGDLSLILGGLGSLAVGDVPGGLYSRCQSFASATSRKLVHWAQRRSRRREPRSPGHRFLSSTLHVIIPPFNGILP